MADLAAALERLRAGDPRGALAGLAPLIEATDDPRAWYAAGLAMDALGDLPGLRAAFGQAAAKAPGWPEPWVQLGRALAARGVREEPERCYREALRRDPHHVEATYRLAVVDLGAGRIDAAEAGLSAVQARAPGHVGALASLADARARRGDLAGAWALLAGAPDDAQVAGIAAKVGPRVGRAAEALARVDAALGGATGPARALLLHARGELLDALDQPAEAFAAWTAANEARGLRFDRAAHRAAIDRVIARTTGRSWPGPVAAADRAALIVGVPRTGSTLLEQALGRHPDVAPGGELEALRDVAIAAARPGDVDWLDALDALDVRAARARYLAALERVDPAAARVTDKMPNNLLHLGLLAMILPGARVIITRRDPVDTAWSCFRQAFGPGLPWAASLPDIAAWIAESERLVAHWRATLPLRFHEVRYEALVQAPEPTLRAVVDFLGLPWSADVLTPERATRAPGTASALEVREPIHARSVGRADRYRAWVEAGMRG